MAILKMFNLGFQWATLDPFLFCVHHDDDFPKGNGQLGVDPMLLKSRPLGNDFEPKDGFRMYHGHDVPGFPVHPHRGFETITIVRKGYVDHADSLGAAGRYGEGDVQWMTAGKGVQHSEMFPLIKTDSKNSLELFQIWLNLPRVNKMTDPDFKMFWNHEIPLIQLSEQVQIKLICGQLNGVNSLVPPVNSWAADRSNETQIWIVSIKKGGHFELPVAQGKVNRSLYLFAGDSAYINETKVSSKYGFILNGSAKCIVSADQTDLEFLLLQSKPIAEPIFQHGPFVMNTREEVVQAFKDYQESQFGGWPWDRDDMVHGHQLKKFAKYPNGKIEDPS